jgi:Kef-type K+ transport system membrane component KefB
VLGELLVGIAAGNFLPPLFGERGIAFVRNDPTLHVLAEIGVLILLFDVGLEADLRALVRVGPSAVGVALIGVVVPFALGWGSARWLIPEAPALAHLFVGATLTATSVGISVRVLKDLGALQRLEGQVILGAAILDDILGLVVLAVMSGLVTAATAGGSGLSEIAFTGIVLKAVVFLGITVGIGHYLSGTLLRRGARMSPGMLIVVGLATCFALAFVAERVGLAGIIGAFAAGLMLDPYGEGVHTAAEETTLSTLLSPISSVFVPLFFVLMGIQVDLGSLFTPQTVTFGGVLVLVAVVGKLASAAGVVARGIDRLTVGIGMVPRGEVGLIFAGIGAALSLDGRPLLSQATFSALVLMVVLTTLLTPSSLRWALRRAATTSRT